MKKAYHVHKLVNDGGVIDALVGQRNLLLSSDSRKVRVTSKFVCLFVVRTALYGIFQGVPIKFRYDHVVFVGRRFWHEANTRFRVVGGNCSSQDRSLSGC